MRTLTIVPRLSRQLTICRPVARIAALSTVAIPRTRTLTVRRSLAAITHNHNTAASRQDVIEKALTQLHEDDELLVCNQCGTQHDAMAADGLNECHICNDPRESVPATGQAWTTLGQAQTSGKFRNIIRQQYPNEPHIYTIQTQSILGIGQRCFLIRTPKGNILWDCLSYIDDATVKEINALGGVDAISISHPHFWTTHLTWSRAFNNAPVFLSAEESELVSRPDVHGVRQFIKEKEFELLPDSGAMRIKTGGHFPGSSVLHYKKSLFVSDSLHVTRSALWDINRKPGTAYYAFLWSHVNTIPLTPSAIAGIISAIKPYDFDVAHGMFPDRDLRNAKQRAFDSARVVINAMGHDAEQYLEDIS
ncbi:hypothetical protein PENNAL_c0003G10465 [Penicillium nalgiovense]|uniref:Metallo-beta-lactamase domain-containing protein n=1 Tax=Penicillium nalgiovense TaxID=60175 RepID=A0A1V6Z637_PENNA|nr:hypothetical protein PENNAL_c0003G10465 [Penicillium nalgiovense]